MTVVGYTVSVKCKARTWVCCASCHAVMSRSSEDAAACASMQVQALSLQGNPHDVVRVTRGASSLVAALLLAWVEMYM